MKRDGFSSRFGLIVATLGMAIGTGNIWRFPRIAAKYDGGAFLIPWMIFLFTWSIPILMAEFTLGKTTRRGPVGAFAKLLGKNAAWMGAFMAFVTLMIATYYSVVTGWVLKYVVDGFQGFTSIPPAVDAASVNASRDAAKTHFDGFLGGEPLSLHHPLIFHVGAVAIGSLIVWRGIRGGVERACKVLIPLLFLILIAGCVWALTRLDGAELGLRYLFQPNWSHLTKPDIWIDALSQSAWSTGAGWGLILAYGASARLKEDAVATSYTTGLGNNSASLLAALFIFPAVFALLGQAGAHLAEDEIKSALAFNGKGNTGLAFVYIPFVFKSIPGIGSHVATAFFVALFFAALSSLIALYEMSARVFIDMGMGRGKAVLVVAALGAGLGAPSALNIDFFLTMDWIWGLALVIGGLTVVWAVQSHGAERFRTQLINAGGAVRPLSRVFNSFFVFLIPLQGVGLLAWWLYAAATNPAYYGEGNNPWDPFVLGTAGAGPCVIWWSTVLLLFMVLAPWLGRASLHGDPAAAWEVRAPRKTRLLLLPLAAAPVLWWLWRSEISTRMDALAAGRREPPEWEWIAVALLIGGVLFGGFLRYLFVGAKSGGAAAEPEQSRPGSVTWREDTDEQ